mmetsp:Transcript_12809/g.32355  ORF Transcript_12809/g.32355 Transcript_12809/m.32355 type:complete len:96 (+) Transcript_12809:179-466(+)
MISEGEITAKISMKERMVLFDESASASSGASGSESGNHGAKGAGSFNDPQHWQQRIDACIHIAGQVQKVDDSLSYNRRFLQNTAIQDASSRFDVS